MCWQKRASPTSKDVSASANIYALCSHAVSSSEFPIISVKHVIYSQWWKSHHGITVACRLWLLASSYHRHTHYEHTELSLCDMCIIIARFLTLDNVHLWPLKLKTDISVTLAYIHTSFSLRCTSVFELEACKGQTVTGIMHTRGRPQNNTIPGANNTEAVTMALDNFARICCCQSYATVSSTCQTNNNDIVSPAFPDIHPVNSLKSVQTTKSDYYTEHMHRWKDQ